MNESRAILKYLDRILMVRHGVLSSEYLKFIKFTDILFHIEEVFGVPYKEAIHVLKFWWFSNGQQIVKPMDELDFEIKHSDSESLFRHSELMFDAVKINKECTRSFYVTKDEANMVDLMLKHGENLHKTDELINRIINRINENEGTRRAYMINGMRNER